MSVPVWEEQQLGNFSHGYPPQMPFQAPLRAASHSALYLSIDAGGDQLVGRAENGKPAFTALTSSICVPHACTLATLPGQEHHTPPGLSSEWRSQSVPQMHLAYGLHCDGYAETHACRHAVAVGLDSHTGVAAEAVA